MNARVKRAVVGFATICTISAVAFAQARVRVYEPPHDIAEEWAKALALVSLFGAAALIAWALVVRRARLGEPDTQWMLFLGVCLLPLPVSMLGMAVGMEQSKGVEFCSSCHVMRPFVDDLRDLGSDTLAATHFKNRYIQREHCFRCHTNYGIFGTLQAKRAGMGHIWKESTGTYELPIKLSRPYDYAICLDCHGQAVKFQKVEVHHDTLDQILSGEVGCGDCHGLAHPPREGRSSE
jgi:cytochrome c nitrite reductase small subunit